MEISEAVTDLITPGGTQMPSNLLKAAGKAAIGAAGAAGAWALNKLRRKQPPNDPPPNEPRNGKLHLKYLGDYYSTSRSSRKYAMPRGYRITRSKSRKRYSRVARIKKRNNFINFYKRSNQLSSRPTATMILHTDLNFNWNHGDNLNANSAAGMFTPASCRGDITTSTTGNPTYGLPAWYFIKKSKEWSVLKSLYEEIKPVKQYFTVKVLGYASNIDQYKMTGGNQNTPRSGYEYVKLLLNADYMAPDVKDAHGILGQQYIKYLEDDQTSRMVWIQDASFGSSGSGLGQARPPTVSI